MKELSIEQKAKAYDEAIWKLRGMMPNWERLSYNGKTFLQDLIYILPELKESEDERIRKELIGYHRSMAAQADDYVHEAWITWLEKQGEQKPATIDINKMVNYYANHKERGNEEFGKPVNCMIRAYRQGLNDAIGKVVLKPAWSEEDKNMLKWIIGYLDNKMLNTSIVEERTACKNAIAWLEKQEGEQKPADKVKPKFKVGDWVVTPHGKVNQIVSVNKDGDGYTLDDDVYFSGSWCDMYHLWTIEDAKDGDVLYECNEKKPFIFKELETKHIGDISSYCDIFNGIFNPNEDKWTTLDIVPATKEQCDLLFQKMKEAGYEWDAEKKELKKIEESFVKASKFEKEEELELKKFAEEWDESLYRSDAIIAGAQWYKQRMKEILEAEYERGKNDTIAEMKKSAEDSCKNSDDITTEEKDMTEYKKGFECGKQRVLKYPEDFDLCKRTLTAWSEEEIEKAAQEWDSKASFTPFHMTLDGNGSPNGVRQDITTHKESFKAGINWILKSLKDRVQPQPKEEWSEEDENIIHAINKLIEEKDKYYVYLNGGTIEIKVSNINNWLKSLKNRVQSQPKQEWSEEDERMLDKCIEAACGYYAPEDKQSMRDWLRGIKDRVQPKQEWKQENIGDLTDFENAMMHIGESFFGKNAGLDPNDTNAIKEQANILLGLVPNKEWSEEDEKKRKRIMHRLSIDGTINNKDLADINDWLKSLRPQKQWKPSDEQMNAFDAILVYNPPCSNECRNHLITLYNELKKLKG